MKKELRSENKKHKLGKINLGSRLKSTNAITLISLVITIVVLIILASTAIFLTLGNNGIFNKAKQAKELTNKQEATEKINLKIVTAQMNQYTEKQEMPTLKELSEILKEDEEIEYLTENRQVASVKYEVGENPSKIYTKLKEYKYEFEINSNLKITSIDGKEVLENNNNNASEGTEESDIITDIELFVSFNNGEYLELTCNAKTVNDVEVAGYAFLLNGEVKKYCAENVANIDGLTLDTNYTVSAIVMDKTGKIKRTNNIDVKTANRVYLYKEGNECNYITGGWKHTGYDAYDWGTITKNTDNMYITAPKDSRIFCGTSKMIDLSKYTGLYIENEGNELLCQITTISYYNNSTANDIGYNSKEKLEISTYNSQYYLHITAANGWYAKIKNIWLEY